MTAVIKTRTELAAIFVSAGDGNIRGQDSGNIVESVIGGVMPTAAKTANYTATEDDEFIPVDATSGAVTITLPVSASTRIGKPYTVVKVDSSVNAVIIEPAGSETVDDAANLILFTAFASVTVANRKLAAHEWLTIAQRGVYTGAIFVQKATAGVTVANTAAETALLGSGVGSLTLPANWLRVGRVIHFHISGFLSDTGTPTGTFTLKFGSTVILTSGALTLGSGVSNVAFEMTGQIVCVATGSSDTVWAEGHVAIADGVNAFKGMVNTTRPDPDTAASQVIGATYQWSSGDPANTLTCTNADFEMVA